MLELADLLALGAGLEHGGRLRRLRGLDRRRPVSGVDGDVDGAVVGVLSGAGSPLRVGLLEADSSPRWR